jgi:hypothetical protein
MSVEHLAVEARAIRRKVVDLLARSRDVTERAEMVVHDQKSIQGAIMVVLDSLEDLDRKIDAARQASRGG